MRCLVPVGLSLQFRFPRHLQSREPASDPGPHGVQPVRACLFNDFGLILHINIFAASGLVDEAVNSVGWLIKIGGLTLRTAGLTAILVDVTILLRDSALRLISLALNPARSLIRLVILTLGPVGLTLRLVKVNIGLGILHVTIELVGWTLRPVVLILRRILRACCIDLLLQINRGKNHLLVLNWQLVCSNLNEVI